MTVVEQLAEVWQRVARGLSCNCLLPHAAQTSDAPHGAAFALLRGEDDRERDETPSTNERVTRRPGWAVPVRNNMSDVSVGEAGRRHIAHLRDFTGGGSAFDGGNGGMGSQGNSARAEEGEGRGPRRFWILDPEPARRHNQCQGSWRQRNVGPEVALCRRIRSTISVMPGDSAGFASLSAGGTHTLRCRANTRHAGAVGADGSRRHALA